MKPCNLLLTGLPGVGKTTVLRKVAAAIRDQPVRGFLTDEIRVGGQRVGFGIETFQGESATLAHVDIRSPHRVGRYRVDVEALERIVDSALRPRGPGEIFLADEIGKMECLSTKFREAMTALLDSGCLVVATIAKKGGGFMDQVKQRPNVEIWEVTRPNRDEMPERILAWLVERESGRNGAA